MRHLRIPLLLLAVLSLGMFDTGCSSVQAVASKASAALDKANSILDKGEKVLGNVEATVDIVGSAAKEAEGKPLSEQIAILIGAMLAALGVWKGAGAGLKAAGRAANGSGTSG